MEENSIEVDRVDESPLSRDSLGKNKESLKVKLEMRRPAAALQDQGILPSPGTPPLHHCQRVKLERAKMSDLLKAKIQQRPTRSELVRQHILEETDSRVAPLLAEKQRMLKRARLADSLNDHLIHRPGPLELVKKNILHAPDEQIEKAIKEGTVNFRATSEGSAPGPPLPTKYNAGEEDSSSDSLITPSDQPLAAEVKPPEIIFAVPISIIGQVVPQYKQVVHRQKSLKKMNKLKMGAKQKTIKFHEYKGPPNSKASQPNKESSESSYQLLLQQQQLFLQWQLEWQHRFPKILLPSPKPPGSTGGALPPCSPPTDPPQRKDWKVNELKAELKKRSLPVSGSKSQLIERLNLSTKSSTDSKSVIQQRIQQRIQQHQDIIPEVKSQMVDDVLEILIRNGELPLDPLPPPPPPLPPSTFSITLPTEIQFKKIDSKEEEILKISQELAKLERLFKAGNTIEALEASKEAPAAFKEAIEASKEAPAAFKEAIAAVKEAPAAVKEARAGLPPSSPCQPPLPPTFEEILQMETTGEMTSSWLDSFDQNPFDPLLSSNNNYPKVSQPEDFLMDIDNFAAEFNKNGWTDQADLFDFC